MDPDVKFSEAGKCWVKLRVVAKDRKRDSNGDWTDGDPLFIDILVFGKYAENLAESVGKGDTVMVKGRLSPNNWTDKEGNERKDLRIMADEIAVSVKWGPARTAAATAAPSGAAAAAAGLGATPVQSDEAPF
jgi:single-strand DNA-binding protein